VPDVLAWLSKLGERFEVELSPHAAVVFDEVSAQCFGGVTYAGLGRHAALPPRAVNRAETAAVAEPAQISPSSPTELRLVAYKPLFSGAAVERTPELAFQQPDAVVDISPQDAHTRGIRNGALVTVSSNGTSLELQARVARDLTVGAVRIARDHAGDLHPLVQVSPGTAQ
jgi:anaerobic selenocysteine-containing dehydrogenase